LNLKLKRLVYRD